MILTVYLDRVEVGRRTRSLNGQALDAFCLADSNLLDFVCHGGRVKNTEDRIARLRVMVFGPCGNVSNQGIDID